jgi:hypothetical protein
MGAIVKRAHCYYNKKPLQCLHAQNYYVNDFIIQLIFNILLLFNLNIVNMDNNSFSVNNKIIILFVLCVCMYSLLSV